MEFWGVEVKAGKPLKIKPEFDRLIHISQASLGVVKDVKGAKNIPLRLQIDDKVFIIGSLSAEERTQLMFDLVFEKEFELSHDWKDGSVYFIGYAAAQPDADYGSPDDFSSEDEPVENLENGLIKPKAEDGKTDNGGGGAAAAVAAAAKPEAVAKKEESSDSDDDEDDSEDDPDDEMALGGSLDGDSSDDLSGEDSEAEGDSNDEEELPNSKQSKKRPARSAQETSLAAKKAKSSTPDKTGKKKAQNATPFPSKAAGKAPSSGDKSKQTPKSGGQFSGKSGNNKSFNSKKAKGKRGGK